MEICYQPQSNCSFCGPSLRTPSVMPKQTFAVRQREREGAGMLIANEDYSGKCILCLLRQRFFNIADHLGRRVSEGQRLR